MRKRHLTVVGLGYVGLPVALLAKEKGWTVTGYDINAKKVALINQGQSPLNDPYLIAHTKNYPIQASTDPAVVKDAEVVIITVDTPVTGTNLPDLRPLTSALKSIRPYLHAGQLLSIESTINPGVMDEVVLPLLKQLADLPADLHVVHCPERINPGDTKWTIRTIPRVLGGYSPQGVKKAQQFYESILDAPVMVMGSAAEAEAVKILENTFRDINIAFVNEMAKSFDRLGLNIMNVIRGASTKPFAFMPHYPGNGVGGHCISVDPYYMIERAQQVGFEHHFLKLARKINDSMPSFTASLLMRGLRQAKLHPKQATVALLGLAYKKDIDDVRNSPAVHIRDLLQKKVGQLRVYDPYLPDQSTASSLEDALVGAQAVLLACDHSHFKQKLTPALLQQQHIAVFIDGKNAFSPQAMRQAGLIYLGIGQ